MRGVILCKDCNDGFVFALSRQGRKDGMLLMAEDGRILGCQRWPSSPSAVRGGHLLSERWGGGTAGGQPVPSSATPSPVSEMTARAESRAPRLLSVSGEP